jgi:hypothetical protein
MMPANDQRACPACGAVLLPDVHGNRRFCTTCVPPGMGGDAIKAWRAVNRDRVAAYNVARRVLPQPKVCVECRREFIPRRSHALVCSEQCRNARRASQRWGHPIL